MASIESGNKHFSNRILACSPEKNWVEFSLVDEEGNGAPYADLEFELVDDNWETHTGILNEKGYAKVEGIQCGILTLRINELITEYSNVDAAYKNLIDRKSYKIPITQLQVRAESTRFVRPDGLRTGNNPAMVSADHFLEVEVSELVRHSAHLPPFSPRQYAPLSDEMKLKQCRTTPLPEQTDVREAQSSEAPGVLQRTREQTLDQGIRLKPACHNVLEVRPLRALRPALSKSKAFNLVNLYNLSLLSTLSYRDFGQVFNADKTAVSFPYMVNSKTGPEDATGRPVGNALVEGMAQFNEQWEFDTRCMTHPLGQKQAFYPVYEDVPYSKRFEVIPYDPFLYPENNPQLTDDEFEHPEKIHFFDDRGAEDALDVQAYITHSDEIVLFSVRGTSEPIPDWKLNARGMMVPIEGSAGYAHDGFYNAARQLYRFMDDYLRRFYTEGHQIIICGHSMGGAVALLAADYLRRQGRYDIQLYTYGAPRSGTKAFVDEAADLVHYRMVNNLDITPLVPMKSLILKKLEASEKSGSALFSQQEAIESYGSDVREVVVNALLGYENDLYAHHGKLYHNLYIALPKQPTRSILWEPNYQAVSNVNVGITPEMVEQQQKNEEHGQSAPVFDMLLRTIQSEHFLPTGYVPACWAALRRWQLALERPDRKVITGNELDHLQECLEDVKFLYESQRKHMIKKSIQYRVPFSSVTDKEIMQGTEKSLELREAIRVIGTFEKDLTYLKGVRADEEYLYGGLMSEEFQESALARWWRHEVNLKTPYITYQKPKMPSTPSREQEDLRRHYERRPINMSDFRW